MLQLNLEQLLTSRVHAVFRCWQSLANDLHVLNSFDLDSPVYNRRDADQRIGRGVHRLKELLGKRTLFELPMKFELTRYSREGV